MSDIDDDKKSLSFGRYLQAARLEKNISLEQVAEQTRVSLGNLMLVEQEDHEQLPAEVFVKGFLRSYAAAVGADGDEAVRLYESCPDVVQQTADAEASDDQSRRRPRRNLIIAFGLLLIMGVSVAAILFLRPTADTQAPLPSPPPAISDKPAAADSQVADDLSAEPAKKIPEKLSLQITARENTWIKIIIDEKEPTEHSLSTGDELELEASTGFNLLIGNAGGVELTLNGDPVALAGESGQVVTIHLP